MTKIRLVVLGLLLTLALPVSGFGQQETISRVDPAAKSIVDRFNTYYRNLQGVSCTAGISVKHEGLEVDDSVFMQARAVRPNRVDISAVERKGLFPTNQFVSNGRELYEMSVRRRMFMLSPVAPDFDALYARTLARSAPNVPVDTFLALLTSKPLENLLQLGIEPGLIRLVGETEVGGLRCHELVVNELGSRVWISAESPPLLMRYQNSPRVARPRYLPPGTQIKGPVIQVDFKSWAPLNPQEQTWDWEIPVWVEEWATMHESAQGGPEDGYTAMRLEENETVPTPSGQAGTNPQGEAPRVSGGSQAALGLPLGSSAPDVKLVKLDDTKVALEKLTAGHPTVLFFWVPGEKFTRSAAPRVVKVLKTLGDQFVVIPIGSGARPEIVRRAEKSQPELAGSFADPGGLVSGAFNVRNTFAVVLLNSKGEVVNNLVGSDPKITQKIQRACLELSNQEKESSEDSK